MSPMRFVFIVRMPSGNCRSGVVEDLNGVTGPCSEYTILNTRRARQVLTSYVYSTSHVTQGEAGRICNIAFITLLVFRSPFVISLVDAYVAWAGGHFRVRCDRAMLLVPGVAVGVAEDQAPTTSETIRGQQAGSRKTTIDGRSPYQPFGAKDVVDVSVGLRDIELDLASSRLSSMHPGALWECAVLLHVDTLRACSRCYGWCRGCRGCVRVLDGG